MEAFGFGELDRAHDVLSHVLLRVPYSEDPDAALMLGYVTRNLDFAFERHPDPTPVAAVGADRQHERLVVFLADDVHLDGAEVARSLGLFVAVDTMVSGPILPAGRPAQGGESVSGDGPGGDTGTLTCLVEDAAQQPLLLGCNHTLAGVNRATAGTDTVRQPGAADGGVTPADGIGLLTDYQRIDLGGVNPNVMDAAVCRPTHPADAVPGVLGIGAIQGLGAPAHGDPVEKVGWKTGHTYGTYQFDMRYTTKFGGTPALFEQQMGIVSTSPTPFAEQGDSGAPVLLGGTDELVGMVIGVAAGIDLALASPIVPILSRFGVRPAV
jgi:hypothetical protein